MIQLLQMKTYLKKLTLGGDDSYKIFYAGYLACWMLRHPESTFPVTVEAYASKVRDIEKYLCGTTWDKSDDTMHHIFMELKQNTSVSPYATKNVEFIYSPTIADYIQISTTAVQDALMMGIAYEVHIRRRIQSVVILQ